MALALDAPASGLDLGSGSGIPGLVLAGCWPDSRWVLVDAARRRTRLLEALVRQLGWEDRVSVRTGRAELLGREADLREQFDLVTARLFGPPAATAECGAPFVRLGGVLAVTEPPEPVDRWPRDQLVPLGLEIEDRRDGIQILRRSGMLEDRFPRNVGVPWRRPLF